MNRRTLLDIVFTGIWVTSGMAMAGGLAVGDTTVFGSGLFTTLITIPLYITYRKAGELY